jgi:hypothetical protein
MFQELYESILDYQGNKLYVDVLQPSIPRLTECMTSLAKFREFDDYGGNYQVSKEDLWQLYAANRVNDVLLLSFQKFNKESAESGINIATVSIEEYVSFFSAIGFEPTEKRSYSPFHHEMVEVQSSDKVDESKITNLIWPGLMFGSMLFSRGGVEIQASPSRIDPEAAVENMLYWAFRRKYRKVHDLSHGWGFNSQWRTAFRRDYEYDGKYYFNVPSSIKTTQVEKPTEEQLELLVYRCFVRYKVSDAGGDFFPFRSHATLPIQSTI